MTNIRIKTNTCRGGVIEDIYVRKVEVGQCKRAVLSIDLVYEPNEIGERGFLPTVRNINMEEVNCQKSINGIFIDALKENANVYNINLSNCNFNGVSNGNSISGITKDIHFNNLIINGQKYNQ